jgi:hypothetical protein
MCWIEGNSMEFNRRSKSLSGDCELAKRLHRNISDVLVVFSGEHMLRALLCELSSYWLWLRAVSLSQEERRLQVGMFLS